jgi:uncharacterized protein (TIGR02266 family)
VSVTTSPALAEEAYFVVCTRARYAARETETRMPRCEACQHPIDDAMSYCTECGFACGPVELSAEDLEYLGDGRTSESPSVSGKVTSGSGIGAAIPPAPPPEAKATASSLEAVPIDIPPIRAAEASPAPAPGAAAEASPAPAPGAAAEASPAPAPGADEASPTPAPRSGSAVHQAVPPGHREGQPQRRSPRFTLRAEVSYASEHNFFTGFLENISDGGLFLATYDLLAIGETVELTLTVPGIDTSFQVSCEVRWIREDNPGLVEASPGMGLAFQDLSEQAKRAIDAFIRHRAPIFFDD